MFEIYPEINAHIYHGLANFPFFCRDVTIIPLTAFATTSTKTALVVIRREGVLLTSIALPCQLPAVCYYYSFVFKSSPFCLAKCACLVVRRAVFISEKRFWLQRMEGASILPRCFPTVRSSRASRQSCVCAPNAPTDWQGTGLAPSPHAARPHS